MERTEVEVDTTKKTEIKPKLTIAGVWFYIRHLGVIAFVFYIMLDNISNSNCNFVAMIFFALIGLSSLVEVGFKIDKLLSAGGKIADIFKS